MKKKCWWWKHKIPVVIIIPWLDPALKDKHDYNKWYHVLHYGYWKIFGMCSWVYKRMLTSVGSFSVLTGSHTDEDFVLSTQRHFLNTLTEGFHFYIYRWKPPNPSSLPTSNNHVPCWFFNPWNRLFNFKVFPIHLRYSFVWSSFSDLQHNQNMEALSHDQISSFKIINIKSIS